MARTAPKAPAYRCSDCGWTSVKWVGRCGECQAWGTVDEIGATRTRGTTAAKAGTPALPIGSVDLTAAQATATGISEFDRVLGGGLVPGAVILLAGEPGVGKSTLLLDVASRWAAAEHLTLYVTGEESTAQVRMRAERIGALAEGLYLAAETDLGGVLGHVEALAPSLLILDSVQTIASAEIDGAAGGVTQVREVAASVIASAKSRGMTAIIVGHVTKDGSVAGPRALEHLVDVVLYFEGDRHSTLRLVRAVKNRFGPADEIGCFELVDDGIIGLADPSGLFLGDRHEPAPGTCVTVTVEGRRPLVTEVQALIAPSSAPQPRRVTSGLDSARIAMMLGVLERRAGLKLATSDCFVATVGGVRLVEPATDLAIALAIASSVNDIALPSGLIAIGEVGLSGDVRKVTALTRRLAEAARLGFTDAIIPRGATSDSNANDITVHEVTSINEALSVARTLASAPKR
ncbi:MAG: DNA repair protein RadA [Candidatus Nanopelagicales bacterium]|nr:DNA repair protein RadA [Candidatus Nanopelagicales bacterium]